MVYLHWLNTASFCKRKTPIWRKKFLVTHFCFTSTEIQACLFVKVNLNSQSICDDAKENCSKNIYLQTIHIYLSTENIQFPSFILCSPSLSLWHLYLKFTDENSYWITLQLSKEQFKMLKVFFFYTLNIYVYLSLTYFLIINPLPSRELEITQWILVGVREKGKRKVINECESYCVRVYIYYHLSKWGHLFEILYSR